MTFWGLMDHTPARDYMNRPRTQVARLKQLEVAPKEADRLVATFVAAFGSTAFATKQEQVRTACMVTRVGSTVLLRKGFAEMTTMWKHHKTRKNC